MHRNHKQDQRVYKCSTNGVHYSLEGQCGHFLPLISFEVSWSQMLYHLWLLGRLNEVNLNRRIILGKVLFYFWWWNEWRGQSTPVVVQSLSCVWLFVTSWTAACQASLSFTISQSLLKLMSLSWWFHPTISSSVIPFSSCLQSFPASGSFPMSWLFISGGQSIGASAVRICQ